MTQILEALKGMLASKKVLTTLTGALLIIVTKLGWNLDEETMWMIVTLFASCVTGQGLADFGKYKATQ